MKIPLGQSPVVCVPNLVIVEPAVFAKNAQTDSQMTNFIYQQSTRPMDDLVPSMQHILLMHTFILVVYRQLTALFMTKNNPGYVPEAKTYLLHTIQNTSLHRKRWGQEYCTEQGGAFIADGFIILITFLFLNQIK